MIARTKYYTSGAIAETLCQHQKVHNLGSATGLNPSAVDFRTHDPESGEKLWMGNFGGYFITVCNKALWSNNIPSKAFFFSGVWSPMTPHVAWEETSARPFYKLFLKI